jgi:hypothetical protein
VTGRASRFDLAAFWRGTAEQQPASWTALGLGAAGKYRTEPAAIVRQVAAMTSVASGTATAAMWIDGSSTTSEPAAFVSGVAISVPACNDWAPEEQNMLQNLLRTPSRNPEEIGNSHAQD